MPSRIMPAYVSGNVPARWVLAVQDARQKEHYLNADRPAREGHEVGDVITAQDPLVNLP